MAAMEEQNEDVLGLQSAAAFWDPWLLCNLSRLDQPESAELL